MCRLPTKPNNPARPSSTFVVHLLFHLIVSIFLWLIIFGSIAGEQNGSGTGHNGRDRSEFADGRITMKMANDSIDSPAYSALPDLLRRAIWQKGGQAGCRSVIGKPRIKDKTEAHNLHSNAESKAINRFVNGFWLFAVYRTKCTESIATLADPFRKR